MLLIPLETTRQVHEQEWSQLIALTAQGKQAELARLYDRAGPQIYGLVLKILDNREATEEVYVLEGGCFCGGGELKAGDDHRAEANTEHHDTASDEGCLLLIVSSPQQRDVVVVPLGGGLHEGLPDAVSALGATVALLLRNPLFTLDRR